jgi:hypothetical protein
VTSKVRRPALHGASFHTCCYLVVYGRRVTPNALLYLLVGAGLALISQTRVQLSVVPRVEARKRREDRWERDVLLLGELLTSELPDRASAARKISGCCRWYIAMWPAARMLTLTDSKNWIAI